MKLLRNITQTANLPDRIVATIGNFDGVHLGHQSLIQLLKVKANHFQCPLLVIIFEPQPSEFFYGDKAPARLSSLREKLETFKSLGVDYVYCLKFNEVLSQIDAQVFSEEFIFQASRVKYLLTGQDFRFGQKRKGDVELLVKIGKKFNAIVETYPNYLIDSERVSSTAIRFALSQGDLSSAAQCLGRSFTISGRVIHGNGIGRQWGIPTANIGLRGRTLPISGVFGVELTRQQDDKIYHGVANIGFRPTLGGSFRLTCEVHIFNFNANIYGELVDVKFIKKLRNEEKFDSVDALIAQIHRDIAAAEASINE
jgi:riboflavin kinase/FMN adenylyltransferase